MADVLWFNGRWTTTDEPVLGVEDRGVQFGDSIYEVTRFSSGRASFNERHFRRFKRAMTELGYPSPWPDAQAFDRHVAELLARTGFDSGIVYLQVTRGACERNHVHGGELVPNVMMYSRRFPFPDAAKKEQGVAVITHPEIRWGRCDLKTTNLLGAVLAKRAAADKGAQEAIFILEGTVTEGAATNFFGVMNGRLVTHPLGVHILPGVVRSVVLELARDASIEIDERALAVGELAQLDEAFLTSTTQGVLPVTSIDGQVVASGMRGAITARLQQLFDEAEAREFADAVGSSSTQRG